MGAPPARIAPPFRVSVRRDPSEVDALNVLGIVNPIRDFDRTCVVLYGNGGPETRSLFSDWCYCASWCCTELRFSGSFANQFPPAGRNVPAAIDMENFEQDISSIGQNLLYFGNRCLQVDVRSVPPVVLARCDDMIVDGAVGSYIEYWYSEYSGHPPSDELSTRLLLVDVVPYVYDQVSVDLQFVQQMTICVVQGIVALINDPIASHGYTEARSLVVDFKRRFEICYALFPRVSNSLIRSVAHDGRFIPYDPSVLSLQAMMTILRTLLAQLESRVTNRPMMSRRR